MIIQKARILKKILDLSSIKPDITKLLLKLLKSGKLALKNRDQQAEDQRRTSEEKDGANLKGNDGDKGGKDEREAKDAKKKAEMYPGKGNGTTAKEKEWLDFHEAFIYDDAFAFLDTVIEKLTSRNT
jgi:hypothetical protein